MTASVLACENDIARVPFSDLSLQWKEIAEAARADIETLFATSSFVFRRGEHRMTLKEVNVAAENQNFIRLTDSSSSDYLADLMELRRPNENRPVPIGEAVGQFALYAAPASSCGIIHLDKAVSQDSGSDRRDNDFRVPVGPDLFSAAWSAVAVCKS